MLQRRKLYVRKDTSSAKFVVINYLDLLRKRSFHNITTVNTQPQMLFRDFGNSDLGRVQYFRQKSKDC